MLTCQDGINEKTKGEMLQEQSEHVHQTRERVTDDMAAEQEDELLCGIWCSRS